MSYRIVPSGSFVALKNSLLTGKVTLTVVVHAASYGWY